MASGTPVYTQNPFMSATAIYQQDQPFDGSRMPHNPPWDPRLCALWL